MVGAEHGRLRSMRGGIEQASITDRTDAKISEEPGEDFQGEVFDHRPSRSNRSAYRWRATARKVTNLALADPPGRGLDNDPVSLIWPGWWPPAC